MSSGLVYLDHAATTPMRPEAVQAMLPFMTEVFANPSGSHRFARQARKSIDEARDVIADAIGCKPGEVVFTGCGTESDNTAITGVIRRTPGVAVCSATEHHAVLHCVEHANGVVVGVNHIGTVDLEALQASLSSEVASVSIMAVNNETGAITDMAAVSKIVRRYAPQAMLHTYGRVRSKSPVSVLPWQRRNFTSADRFNGQRRRLAHARVAQLVSRVRRRRFVSRTQPRTSACHGRSQWHPRSLRVYPKSYSQHHRILRCHVRRHDGHAQEAPSRSRVV